MLQPLVKLYSTSVNKQIQVGKINLNLALLTYLKQKHAYIVWIHAFFIIFQPLIFELEGFDSLLFTFYEWFGYIEYFENIYTLFFSQNYQIVNIIT